MGSLLHVEYCSEDLETTNSLNLHKQPYKIRAIIITPILQINLLLPLIFPSIRDFSNELSVRIR